MKWLRTVSSKWLNDDHSDMIKIFSFWNDDKPALCKGWGFDALCLLSKRQSFSLSYKKDCITLTSFQREYDRISERYFLQMKKTGNSEKTAPQKNSRNLIISKGSSFCIAFVLMLRFKAKIIKIMDFQAINSIFDRLSAVSTQFRNVYELEINN